MSDTAKKQPAPVFTQDTTEWVAKGGVHFHSPSRETGVLSTGVAAPAIVWRALCTYPGCDTEFRLGMPLKKDGNVSAPYGRRYCTAHARLSRGLPCDPWDNPTPVPPFFTDADGRSWRWLGYEKARTLGGEPVALTVWESECLVGGCNGVVVQKGLPNAEGYPSFTLNAYCVDHKQGGSKAAAGYDATFKRMQADYDAATPEEKARIDAKKAALVERARQREIVRRTAYRIEAQDASLPEQRKRWERQLRMAVECGAKTVEALARKRGRSAADTQKRIAESRIRIERKWVREWDAAHPEAPFYHGPDYAGPSTTAVVHSPCQAHLRPPPVSAPPVSPPPVSAPPVSAPPVSAPAPAQDAVARAEREYSAVFRVLSANATGATLENLDPEYKAILTWAANQANGAPVFDRISSNKPTEADASAIVALFERLPMAPTLEWEGAWRMAHRLGHLYTDPQRRNREGVRVTGLEDAFNAAFGWQPGHNCYHSQTEDKLLAKALHESRAQLVKASATLDRVREQMEELPLLALVEDVAQVEADLVAQEIEAQESLERIQRQRERMLRRKAERDLDDATQKALREKHKEPDCPIPAYLYQRGAGQDSDYNP